MHTSNAPPLAVQAPHPTTFSAQSENAVINVLTSLKSTHAVLVKYSSTLMRDTRYNNVRKYSLRQAVIGSSSATWPAIHSVHTVNTPAVNVHTLQPATSSVQPEMATLVFAIDE